MSLLASLLTSAQAAQDGQQELRLAGGRVGELLTVLQIVRDLGRLAEVETPFDTPEGLQARLDILATAAEAAVLLTESTTDDAFVSRLRCELDQPEVLAFAAYLLRRASAGS